MQQKPQTYVVYVTEFDAFERLPQDLAHCLLVKAVRTAFKVIEHRVIDELEDEVESLLASKHLDQVHQVVVT